MVSQFIQLLLPHIDRMTLLLYSNSVTFAMTQLLITCSLYSTNISRSTASVRLSIQPGEHRQTNGQTDGRADATKYIISRLRGR